MDVTGALEGVRKGGRGGGNGENRERGRESSRGGDGKVVVEDVGEGEGEG